MVDGIRIIRESTRSGVRPCYEEGSGPGCATRHDVAHAVAFLASEQAAYITGQVLAVDGGMVM